MSATRRATPPVPGAVDRLVNAIDGVSTATGWLIVPMTIAVVYEVVARYAFGVKAVAPEWTLTDIHWGMLEFMVLQLLGLVLALWQPLARPGSCPCAFMNKAG